MNIIVEKIIFYAIGGIVGVALGTTLQSFHFTYIDSLDPELFMIVAGLLGMLISSVRFEYKKEEKYSDNKKVQDETVALITHEMRTGLTSTGWAIQVILENYKTQLTEEHRKMLDDVVKSIGTTVMHSVNLLDTSLLDIGKLAVSLKQVKLALVKEIFQQTAEKYALGASQAGITLISSIHLDSEPIVEVDMLRLRIILENLLENSIQYTFGDEKKIMIDITNDTKNIYMKVTDTGMGIPIEEQENIFSAFFRASNARRKQSTGSGIGLHMCYQYVKVHHGTIRFESTEGKGTTFYITIPLKTSADVKEFMEKM